MVNFDSPVIRRLSCVDIADKSQEERHGVHELKHKAIILQNHHCCQLVRLITYNTHFCFVFVGNTFKIQVL